MPSVRTRSTKRVRLRTRRRRTASRRSRKSKGGGFGKSKSNPDTELLCYGGPGARPDWRHTRAQYAEIMATQPNDLKYCAKDKTKNGCAPCIEYRKKAGESARAQVAAARASGTRPLINIELMPGYAEMRARCDACIASAPPRACDLDELIEYNNVEVVGPGNCEGAPVPAPAPSFGRRMWTQFANFVGVAPAVVR